MVVVGEFIRIYGYESKLNESTLEEHFKQRVISDACNQGYTPNGDPILAWNTVTGNVRLTLPVVETTRNGY